MAFPLDPTTVTHGIQLAVAPVFLLTAIGTLLAVLTNRLGRAVDRRRSLDAALGGLEGRIAEEARRELGVLEVRGRLIYTAIALAVTSALFVCLLIALAFLDALVAMDLARVVVTLFVLSLFSLILGLAVFLREIFLAVNSPRTPVL